jgi:hypothetical protein
LRSDLEVLRLLLEVRSFDQKVSRFDLDAWSVGLEFLLLKA